MTEPKTVGEDIAIRWFGTLDDGFEKDSTLYRWMMDNNIDPAKHTPRALATLVDKVVAEWMERGA